MNNERINTLSIIARHLRELAQGGNNLDEAYIWFNGQCKIHNLTSCEEFRVVLLAGTMKMDLEKVPASYPWEDKRKLVVFDEVPQPVKPGEFTQLVECNKTKSNVNRKQLQARAPTRPLPSNSCLRDAKKACGVFPYDEPGNYLVGDGYFSRDCIRKYGEKMWNYACELVRKK